MTGLRLFDEEIDLVRLGVLEADNLPGMGFNNAPQLVAKLGCHGLIPWKEVSAAIIGHGATIVKKKGEGVGDIVVAEFARIQADLRLRSEFLRIQLLHVF